MSYTITLGDGSKLEGLERNGNTFETAQNITEETFDGKLGHIVVEDGETEEEFENVILVRLWKVEETTYFVLRELTQDEVNQIQNRADIEYIAMMCNVELD